MDLFGLTRTRGFGAVVCGLIAVACTAPTPSAPATTSHRAGPAPTLVGSIAIAGDFNMTASFTTSAESLVKGSPSPAPAGATCTGYARGFGNASSFATPEVKTGGRTGLYFRASMSFGYAGPGMYRSGSAPSLSGVAAVTVPSSGGGATTLYNPRRGGTTTLTVAPDGSGTLTFSRWASTETRGTNIAGFLDGTVQWSCR